MQIAKLLFIIISGAALFGGCGGGVAAVESTPLTQAAKDNNVAEAESQAVNGHWLGADVGTYRVRRPSSQSLTPSLEEWNPEAESQAAAERARREAEREQAEQERERKQAEQERETRKALYDAAENDNTAEVIRALAKGADVNTKDEDGWTPLHVAAGFNAAEVAKLLIAKGAEIDGQDKDGGEQRGGGCETTD